MDTNNLKCMICIAVGLKTPRLLHTYVFEGSLSGAQEKAHVLDGYYRNYHAAPIPFRQKYGDDTKYAPYTEVRLCFSPSDVEEFLGRHKTNEKLEDIENEHPGFFTSTQPSNSQ